MAEIAQKSKELSSSIKFEMMKKRKPCKSLIYRTFLKGPGRTRPHDIQRSAAGRLQGKNHKQVVELPSPPVSIGIFADFDFYFAAIVLITLYRLSGMP